jgi:Zn ribbon nucleic-acid-binding protein
MTVIVEDYCPKCERNRPFEIINADWDYEERQCLECGYKIQDYGIYCPDYEDY